MSAGASVSAGHSAGNLALLLGASVSKRVVVASSAVPQNNPEVVEARRMGIPILKREGWMSSFTEPMNVLAVAGTHGKTTTSALLAFLLWRQRERSSAGPPLLAVIGGDVPQFPDGSGALCWQPQSGLPGPADIVVEADEYDGAFLGLRAAVAIVTTADHDHVDCFTTHDEMLDAFVAFARQATGHRAGSCLSRLLDHLRHRPSHRRVKPGGLLLACGDDPGCQQLLQRLGPAPYRVVTYGFHAGSDFLVQRGADGSFSVSYRGCPVVTARTGLAGRRWSKLWHCLQGRPVSTLLTRGTGPSPQVATTS